MIRVTVCFLCFMLFPSTPLWASTSQTHFTAQPAAKTLAKHLKQKYGIDPARTRALIASARYRPDILARMRTPAEKTLTWAEYRPIFVQADRAQAGARYIARHRAIFDRVTNKYGVPAYIVAAIIGVETRYGKFIGKDRVLDALTTLAFDYPERSAFFTRELGAFIRLCLSEKLACRKEKGSYAGAMGLAQFMPSSYIAYAVDGNNNGKRDLWKEPADIIASVAHYLAAHGWQRGQGIALPAHLAQPNGNQWFTPSKRHPAYRWRALRRLGVRVTEPPADNTPVGLIVLRGPHGPEYWVGLKNFFVITTYNHSRLYAMATYQLGREIATMLRASQKK